MKRILVAGLMLALLVCAVPAMGATYPDQTLSGGYQAGHFNDVWDLTAGDMTLSFTYDGNGLVDDAGTHAWSELGVRSVGSGDFNPMLTVYWTKTIDLFAGQNIDVGNVMIQRVGNLLYITYVTSDNWALTETHLAVGTIDVNGVCTGITQTKKGNPIPGQFPYNMIHDPPVNEYTYVLDASQWTPSTKLCIASHAAVVHITEDCVNVYSDATESFSAYGGSTCSDLTGRTGTAELAWEPYSDGTPSVWDTGVGTGTYTMADWIWEEYRVENPVCGDVVNFEKDVMVPGLYLLDASGTMKITTDNGYEFFVNGVSQGSAQVVGNWRTSDLTESYVKTDGWQSVETYSAFGDDLAIGSNTFRFETANEYMGTLDSQSDGTIASNPGGLIYEGEICYTVVDQEETAWGGTNDFSGANWATYLTYKPTATPGVQGSGLWLATDYDWTPNTFDSDPPGAPTLDLDDKLILQRQGGQGEGAYNLPSTPPAPGNNHRVWWDRDGVDPWQNSATANTGGIYQIEIHLSATSDTTGTAYMKIRNLWQGFETDGNWNTIELTPAGMTFTGDMEHMQVFYGIYGYGATHTAKFTNIQVTQ